MSAPLDRKALLALLFGAALIGGGTVLVRLAGTGPAAAGWWRLAFAAPWLILLAHQERQRGPRTGPAFGAPAGLLLLCGLSFAVDLVCWHYSLHLTSIANSSVLANMTPVIVTVLAWLLFRERPAGVFLAGLACALAGAAVMALSRRGGPGGGSAPLVGDGLALAASTSYAIYFMLVRVARRTASAVQVMLSSSLSGAPLALAAAFAFHERLAPTTALGWAACVLLGLMHVGGQGAIAWSLGRVPTAMAAVIMLGQPVVAALAAWATFGEAVTPLQALGAGLALAGVAVAQVAARPPTPPMEGEAEAAAAT